MEEFSKSPHWEEERLLEIDESEADLAAAERWRETCRRKLEDAEASVERELKRRERALAVEKAGA